MHESDHSLNSTSSKVPWIREELHCAIEDLRRKRLPFHDLTSISAALDSSEPQLDSLPWPYFIPNDPTQCTSSSILNCSYIDQELEIDKGFLIEASSTRPRSFAKPYYIDPVGGVRRCKHLWAFNTYEDRDWWDYDLTFVGHRGWASSAPGTWDSRETRRLFLNSFTSDFIPSHPNVRIWLRTNENNFFSDPSVTEERREELNVDNQYIQSLSSSRFVLCPRGLGKNSIRFFEALAVSGVPIYIGDADTKFPLDWIIPWHDMCFRITSAEVMDSQYFEYLETILLLSDSELNRMRRRAFEVYHQFLAPERRNVFEALVLLRAWELLYARPLTHTSKVPT